MSEPNKDTIYVDIDDEITGIIDKVRSSNGKIVALVLPKRATVFQSVVNMKLLKRAGEQAKKNLVLITAETSLLPLAGAVGIHVASSLTSKPEIPAAPLMDDGREETVEETANLADPEEEITAENAGDRPIGELAAGTAAAASLPPPPDDGVETLELDNDEEEPATAKAAPAAAVAAAAPKVKKNKKLKIPNFNRFRLALILGVVILIALIVGLYFCLSVLPRATIAIQTDASTVNTSVNLILDTSATKLNPSTGTIPAKQVQEQKTYTATTPATGQQNNGQTASGSVTFSSSCSSDNFMSDIPAGTGVSYNGLTYITQNDAVLKTPGGTKGSCQFTATANISAQQPGAKYNTPSNVTFTLAQSNDNSYDASTITTTGSASGGTDDIEQVIQQSDIDNAESKITTSASSVKQALQQQLQQDNLYAILATFTSGTPATTPSADAGSPASSVTVTETITYSMYGVSSQDLQTLLTNNIQGQLSGSSQNILNDGLNNASFTVGSNATNLTLSTAAEVGPNISQAAIQRQAAGQKSQVIIAAVKNDPDVTNVSVHFSPFWVTTAPKNTAKIKVDIAKPKATPTNATSP